MIKLTSNLIWRQYIPCPF